MLLQNYCLRKKLMQRLPSNVAGLLPKKALVAHVKILTFSGTTVNIYTVEKEPMFFDFDAAGYLFPTLYFTWINPRIFPMLVVYDSVFRYLENGADLMLQGVVRNRIPLASFPRGAAVTISILADNQLMGPMVVGTALLSSDEMIMRNFEAGLQNFWAKVYKYYTSLKIPYGKEFGSRTSPTVNNLGAILNTTNELEDQFPPLGNLSESVVSSPDENHSICMDTASDDVGGISSGNTQPVDSMDELLLRCFLAALKFRLEELPMDVGQFYSNCLLKCVPTARRLDMKKTKYKKFTVFLDEVNKSEDGPLVQLKKLGKGSSVITEVFKSHPALRSFVVTDEIIHDEQETPTICGPKINEFYSITELVLPFLRCCGNYSKGQLLTVSEIRDLVTKYVKSEELNQRDFVRLDPILASVTNIQGETADWNTLVQKIQSKMTKTFVLRMPDGRELVKKINMPKIILKVETRTGNKKVTLINNLSAFGIDAKKLCQQIQVEAATSATITNEAINCEGPQIIVLGNQVNQIGHLLQNNYKIDKKYITGLELGVKKPK
ncbi:hypothetical protein DICVIV_07179 [Dictyocaulus viviparus]|uniref:SUI1 domain-containing protein n=1 Tax=Dictyocaulus viviparus TaxID=29172 RepID=A0A0D8XQ55_DICVI|nr:hypothetical protein DICVIV_07179 [Dictyocaulus viviparus]